MNCNAKPRRNRFAASWKAKFLLVAGSTVSALALGEIIVRTLYPPMEVEVSRVDYSASTSGHAFKASRKLGSAAIDGYPDQALYIMTPAGKRMLPNSKVTVRHHALSGREIDIRVNSFGFRGPELSENKTRPRVLFLGDSVTFSDFMDENETFVHRAGETLRSRGFDIETINAGVGSIGMENELAILLDTGFAAKPDIVVLDFYLNDAEPSPGVWIAQPPSWIRWSALARLAYSVASKLGRGGNHPAFEEFNRWLPAVEKRFEAATDDTKGSKTFRAKVVGNFCDWGSAWSDDAWEKRFMPCLEAFEKACDARNIDFVVICFPVRAQVESEKLHDYPQRKMKDFCEAGGIPCLDLLPVLRRAFADNRKRVFYDQCHPTPETAAVIAGEIADFLQETEKGKLDETARKPRKKGGETR
jgi:hypothetical protein